MFVSPIGLAANIGDYGIMDALLQYLQNVKIDTGLYAKALNAPIINNRQNRQLVRRVSPLQYACSLGLYKIVERLL